MAKVSTLESSIFQLGLLITEETLRSSMKMRAEKVMVTMLVKLSLNRMTAANMMMQP